MGLYSPHDKNPHIVVRDAAQLQMTKTLTHEAAHHYTGMHETYGEFRAEHETVAESVAFVVCSRFGLDTADRSVPYIAGWSEDKARFRSVLGTIQGVSAHLIDRLEARFGASGIYLRVTRCSGRVVRIAATAHRDGGYSARVRVPKHGIRKLVVGLEGIQIIGDQRRRADVYFAFDPPLRRSCCQEQSHERDSEV